MELAAPFREREPALPTRQNRASHNPIYQSRIRLPPTRFSFPPRWRRVAPPGRNRLAATQRGVARHRLQNLRLTEFARAVRSLSCQQSQVSTMFFQIEWGFHLREDLKTCAREPWLTGGAACVRRKSSLYS